MAKKNNAIYAPGELSKVREKLGVTDEGEAKRMMQLLGGEIGSERVEEVQISKSKKMIKRGQSSYPIEVAPVKRHGRRVDITGNDEDRGRSRSKPTGPYPGDDPTVPARLGYIERVKIDQYASQMIFEIKSSMQVVTSIFSFFKEPVDYVNQRFVTKRMNEYYNKIERLVSATRNLFPKSNNKRNNQLKRASIFVYKILDTMRSWNIEGLAENIAELQAHPRAVKVSDFPDILRYIYKPLFILDDLSIENIKSAFKLIYKVLYIESPIEAKDKYQVIIRNIITSLMDIRRNVHFGMYPLLMKLISDRFIVYERFFTERRRRFLAFLDTTEAEQLNAVDLSPQQIENIDVEALQKNLSTEDEEEELSDEVSEEEAKSEEDPSDPKTIERRAIEEAEKAEQKVMDQGRKALEAIFPQAGWEKLHEFPDLYPYFANVYNMKHGYELIAPTDPLQQVSVLMNILDDLFIGLRYVSFGIVTGPDGNSVRVSDQIGETLNNWRRYIEDSFSKDYLPRLSEYCRILENSQESRASPYARKILNEIHWIKRLYFLPYYKFESIGPPPFTKNEIVPIYSMIRKIRKILTGVAMGIEQGIRAGGASAKASCNGINNPWENYNFQVPNPVSKRLDLLLPPERRINASIIFFTLSAVSILDHLINYETSWAYGTRPGPPFRSVKNEGLIPLFGVDEKLDADQIFRDILKKNKTV